MTLAERDLCDDSAVYVDDDLWALIAPLLRALSSEPSGLRRSRASKGSLITVYAVTSLAAEQTPPAHLDQLARRHWRAEAHAGQPTEGGTQFLELGSGFLTDSSCPRAPVRIQARPTPQGDSWPTEVPLSREGLDGLDMSDDLDLATRLARPGIIRIIIAGRSEMLGGDVSRKPQFDMHLKQMTEGPTSLPTAQISTNGNRYEERTQSECRGSISHRPHTSTAPQPRAHPHGYYGAIDNAQYVRELGLQGSG